MSTNYNQFGSHQPAETERCTDFKWHILYDQKTLKTQSLKNMFLSTRAFAFGVFNHSKGQSCCCFWAKPWDAPTMREDVQLSRQKTKSIDDIVFHAVFHFFLFTMFLSRLIFPSLLFQKRFLGPSFVDSKKTSKIRKKNPHFD